MTQLNQAMATLKLRLAEMKARDSNVGDTIRQFETQLKRIPRQTMYGRVPLDLALGSMAEIEERLKHAKTTRSHLRKIIAQSERELQALGLLKRIEKAQSELAQLRRNGDGPLDEETQSRINRLESYIASYSKEAERAITDGIGQGRI